VSDEPLTMRVRTLDRSWARRFSGSDTVRWSITGTKATSVAACFSISSSDSFGSNRSGSTNVEPNNVPTVKLTSPNEWNIGAGHRITSRRCHGIMDINPVSSRSSAVPVGLSAPFGRPTVPEVWTTNRGRPRWRVIGGSGLGECFASRPS
jgi:hypothetical protein